MHKGLSCDTLCAAIHLKNPGTLHKIIYQGEQKKTREIFTCRHLWHHSQCVTSVKEAGLYFCRSSCSSTFHHSLDCSDTVVLSVPFYTPTLQADHEATLQKEISPLQINKPIWPGIVCLNVMEAHQRKRKDNWWEFVIVFESFTVVLSKNNEQWYKCEGLLSVIKLVSS